METKSLLLAEKAVNVTGLEVHWLITGSSFLMICARFCFDLPKKPNIKLYC